MPSPSQSLATLRPDLSDSVMEFDLEMNENGFIADEVCPVLDVAQSSGNFGKIPIEQLLQSPDVHRAPGSGYNRSKFTFKPDTYATQEYGFEEPVDDAEAAMYKNYFIAETISAARARSALLIGREQRVATLIQDTAAFTGAKTGAAAFVWSNHASATPIDDVETAVLAVWANCGMWPTSIVLTRKAFRHLRNCAQIVDRLKYNGLTDVKAENITAQVLAQVFDLRELIVANAAKNTAAEGQTAAISSVWTDTMATVCRIDHSSDVRRPTVARTFHWGEDGSTIGGTMEEYRDEKVRGNVIRNRHQTHEKLMYAAAGYLITGVLS